MQDDIYPHEDDSEEVLNNSPENSDEYVENEYEFEMSCSDDSSKNDFRKYNVRKDNIIKWYTPLRHVNTPQRNIVIHLSGVKSVANNAKTLIHSREFVWPNNGLQEITTCTKTNLATIFFSII